MSNKPTPHPHAELIKAWAGGAKIQSRFLIDYDNVEQWSDWTDDDEPEWWNEIYQFRVKPEKPSNETWKPQKGEEYFYLFLDNVEIRTYKHAWKNDCLDNALYRRKNVFPTKEEAEAAVPRIKKVMKILCAISDKKSHDLECELRNKIDSLTKYPELDGKPLSTGEKKLIQAIRKTVLRGAYNEDAILVFPLDGSVDSTSYIIAFDTHGDDINDNKIREAINLITEEQTEEEIKNGQKPKKRSS